jgi:ABC-2 type transport system permease protein
VLPILLVVNVPARVLTRPLAGSAWWPVAGAVVAAVATLVVSRLVFQRALARYRSASS